MADDHGLRDVMFSDAYGRAHVAKIKAQIAPTIDALVQRCQQAGVIRSDVIGGHAAGGSGEELGQARPRVRVPQSLLRPRDDLVDARVEQGFDQVLPAREAAIHRAHPEARVRGDVIEGHIHPAGGEHLPCRSQDALPVAFSVAPQGPLRRASCHRRSRSLTGGTPGVVMGPSLNLTGETFSM